MQNVLLTNSKFIKSITNISDNVNDKMILPAVREAQDIDLKRVMGECLLNRLKQIVADREVDKEGNEAYKDLLDQIQYFLAYQTISRLCVILSYKIDNIGISRTRDELIDTATFDEVVKMEAYYQNKADVFKKDLQNFLLNNRSAFPELNECTCNQIRANLYSSATSGLVLGGKRGKIS